MSAARDATSACGNTDVPIKRCRVDDIDPIFTDFPETMKKQIAIKLHDLCDTHHGPALNSLRFTNCNAADVNGGTPFSMAYCSVTPVKSTKCFGTIFIDVLTMMSTFLEQGTIPDSKPQRFVLAKLLHYLVNVETQAALLNLDHYSKTELTIVLANHLFGKLATSTKYVIDKNHSGKKIRKCPCSPECEMLGVFGDTSIGNEEVWHGCLDIIVNQDLGVSTVKDDDDNPHDSQGLKSPAKETLKSCQERKDQLIAQTVTFSFLQKQNHVLSNHFLFPCVGVTSVGLVVYFYDSEHDVLLQSSPIPFLVSIMKESSMKVNLTAILVSWLAVNYKYLSSGLSESLKSDDRKADFCLLAKDKIEVYRSDLKSGDIGAAVRPAPDYEDSYEVSPAGLDEARRRLYDFVWKRKEGKECDPKDN